MNLFSRKEYPKHWLQYTAYFKRQASTFSDIRFVVFDTETTGLNLNKDRILSIGAIGIQNKKIQLNDVFECFVEQEKFSRSTVEIHGIRKTTAGKILEEDALFNFLNYIQNAVLVGHHIHFDFSMINIALNRLGLPKLKNKCLDTGNLHLKTLIDIPRNSHFSLDELANIYRVPLHDRHNSSGDAFITAQIFIKILSKLEKTNPLSLSYLKRPAKRIGLL